MLQHTRRSEDNSVGSVLSLHLYMGCGDLIQVMRFVGQAPLPTATLKLQVTKYCKKKKKKMISTQPAWWLTWGIPNTEGA